MIYPIDPASLRWLILRRFRPASRFFNTTEEPAAGDSGETLDKDYQTRVRTDIDRLCTCCILLHTIRKVDAVHCSIPLEGDAYGDHFRARSLRAPPLLNSHIERHCCQIIRFQYAMIFDIWTSFELEGH